MVVQTPNDADEPPPGIDAGVIEDARRRQSRHRKFAMALLLAATVIALIGYHAVSGPPARSHRGERPGGSDGPLSPASRRALALTRSPDLIQPTTLASLPDGHLLILDSSRDQILELNPDGRLSVFAGTGRLGFSGDGGPARDAELHFSYFSSAPVAVTANGSVDFLDDGGCRIRQVNPAGIIETLLRLPRSDESGGTCDLTGLAVSPAGQLYVSTDSQVERFTRTGHLVPTAGANGSEANELSRLTAANVVFSPVSITFDRGGDLFIASFSPKAVYRLTPAGKLSDLGASYPTQLSTDPGTGVLVGTHFGVIQTAGPTRLGVYDDINPKHVTGIDWGSDGGFQENGITVTGNGTVYVDNAQGNGYGAASVLVRVNAGQHASLVPIRTPLAATLPRVGAPGFPIALYPAAHRSRGTTLSSCPSDAGLQRFTPGGVARARAIARTYLSQQFASDIAVTDRAGWAQDFAAFTDGADLGIHTVHSDAPASDSPIAAGLSHACGHRLVEDSISVTVGKSADSSFSGTLYFLDRDGHPLVYDVR